MRGDRPRQSVAESRWVRFLEFGAFAALLFGIKLWLIATYGNATPFWDQWGAEAAGLYKPVLEGTLRWGNLFAPHNEHRIFTTRLLALALLAANGIWNPLLQMVANAALHIVALGFGIALLARVVGGKYLPYLLVFSLALFGIPYAWENTLAGFQSQFYFLMLFGISSLWFTVTGTPLSVRWWGGVACAILAFLSLASGILALAAAALIGAGFYVLGLRKTNPQLLAVAILAGLFMLGLALTPTVAHHASLRAASFAQFLAALTAVLSWPVASYVPAAVVRNLPALVFVGVMLWKRPPATDRRWFLLALVMWALGQSAGIAYGRAVGSLSSRYLDLFALGVLVNFACLISIARDDSGRWYRWSIDGVILWAITVFVSLGLHARNHLPAELAAKRDTGLAQEINTRTYLATDDIAHLKDKLRLHIPHPSAERLASILASPTVRSILPGNIRRPLTPASVESIPEGAFLAGGHRSAAPKRTDWTLGSYGAQGNAATGRARIGFDAIEQSTRLAIPVAGYPLHDDIRLEIEQNGERRPVVMKSNPKDSWGTAYFKVDKGPFFIVLADLGNTGWLAVAAPAVAGRLDGLTNDLLANYRVFIALGLAAMVLALARHGLRIRAARSVAAKP